MFTLVLDRLIINHDIDVLLDTQATKPFMKGKD
jgi:hypothetical protein